ncbi:bifunctional diguanylate cyclase/phosphodiesterase [Psychromonas sp. RZ22]|uniref:bifunctional diguanylate cyclase/phosphodiesterase n=1 Tax=Psychromonas algarum TaxID=2555643 RepID=UPI0010682AD7|nr:EAL domain-containing protein [Psychromonas sp. RZ22]TEW56844.1 bifunctional diguanylate cyclase/phosphodiesterase [Psychromonas sp. RZ22]
MRILNRNAWVIYYALLALGGLLLLANISSKYEEVLSKDKYQQRYLTQIVASDINRMLLKFETMIDLVSEDFNKENQLNQSFLKNILERSDFLIGFAIYNLDGTLREKSNNLPDRIRSKESEQNFHSGFDNSGEKDYLMVSRPILSPTTQKWLIPIRKLLLDKNEKAIGYMSSAIHLDKLKQRWSASQTFENTIILSLDYNFNQLLHTSLPKERYADFYTNPLPTKQIENADKLLKKQNLTRDMLRKSGDVVNLIITVRGKKVLHSMSYDKQYRIWTHTSRPFSDITTPVIHSALYYSILYFIFAVITFFLFRWIIKTENSKLDELTYYSEHDNLTGCYNRSVLARLAANLAKTNKHFSLLYIDLDDFKNINESFGYRYGDILLKEVSQRLQQSLTRLPGHVIRYNGDEFILLLKNNDTEVIQKFTTTLLSELAQFYSIQNNSFSITSSIGISRYPDDARNLDTLTSYAENSMLMAKKIKNQYVFFSQEIHQHLLHKIKIEQALHHAIDNNQISIVYQPQLDQQQNLYGVEALVRWNSDELGFIAPSVFIPIAEETGLMPKLGQYIMNTAISEITSLQKQLNINFALSINVSVRQFVQVNFFELLMASINDHGYKKLPITIEITESLFIESLDILKPIFKKMKENNISLALDDFGTGYSSLSMLREIPIDELKIDKSFVDHITTNETDKAMVKSIISMGKNLNMRVLAEGVETVEHVNILKESECDLFQGYYFSHPLTQAELETFCKQLKNNKLNT